VISLSSRGFGPRKLMKVSPSVFPIGCAGMEKWLSTLFTTTIAMPLGKDVPPLQNRFA
jgi:hypothetical protein